MYNSSEEKEEREESKTHSDENNVHRVSGRTTTRTFFAIIHKLLVCR
jgi:hypothetical protein